MVEFLRRKHVAGLFLQAITVVLIALAPACGENAFEISFGVIDSEGSDEVAVIETTEIPLRYASEGCLYGVKIAPADRAASYEVRFVHQLPAAPEARTGRLTDAAVDASGRVIEGKPHAGKGVAVFPFGFDEGDPPGDYQLTVVIDGNTEAVIRYSVAAPNSAKSP